MPNDGDNRKKMGRWLRPFMFPFDEGEPKASFVSVKHVSVSGKFADVRTLKVKDKAEESDFVAFVTDLEQSILDDVEGTGGLQRYIVQALDESKHQVARLTLRYAAVRTEDEAEGGFDSEPATPQGITAQLMRHNEALERIDKAGWGNIINVQSRQIEALTEQNAVLVQKHLDMLSVMEELHSLKHQRELETFETQAKIENKGKVWKQVIALLPALASKVTGEKIDGNNHPDIMSFRSILQSLNEEQLVQIQSVLTPDQQISLLSLIKGEAEKTDGN